jgi:hypothetical protein
MWLRFAQALACGIRAIFAFPGPARTAPVGVLSRPQRYRRPLSAADQDQVGRYAHTATVLLRATANVNDAGQVSMSLPRERQRNPAGHRHRHGARHRR